MSLSQDAPITTICQTLSNDVDSSGTRCGTRQGKQANGALSRVTTPSLQTPPSRVGGVHSAASGGGGGPSNAALPNSTCDPSELVSSHELPGVRRRRSRCCTKRVRKFLWGIVVAASMTVAWVGATHFIKRTFLYRESGGNSYNITPYAKATTQDTLYDAPFLTTWFCTMWIGVFFPLYLLTVCCCSCRSKKSSLKSACHDSIRTFRDKGFTFAKVLSRVGIFCALWVGTNYMYIHALRVLDATDVMALYSSSVSFFYLLSWVILHEQFVGVRIVAVILCNTGIALLAYMDGLTRTPTLGGVILAAASSAGSAVYKVLFKKVIGEANSGQVALFFTLISVFNTFFLWPVLVTLYFTNLEVIRWPRVPWTDLLAAAGLSLVSNLLGNFGVAVTYEIFITLGLIIAVPVSAAIDIRLYQVKFEGMKLAGIILISIGFLLVLFPENWPDYITRLLRWRRTRAQDDFTRNDTSTGGARSRLRSPSGLVR